MKNLKHTWRFARLGGFDQVRIDTGQDIANLHTLDQKLWVALSCPIDGIEFDKEMLKDLDFDCDGRIRAPEVLMRIDWLTQVLTSLDGLIKDPKELPLSEINTSTPEGRELYDCAKRVLAATGKTDSLAISIDELEEFKNQLASAPFNGDGVISEQAVKADADAALCYGAIVNTLGTVSGADGKEGIDEAKVEEFFKELEQYQSWQGKALSSSALPLGEHTADGYVALRAVEAKVEDYFTRCQLAAFDAEAQATLNPVRETYLAYAGTNIAADLSTLEALPLARVAANAPLPLTEGLNPGWISRMVRFKDLVVTKKLGKKDFLTYQEWLSIKDAFQAFVDWQNSMPDGAVSKLAPGTIVAIKPGASEKLKELIKKDQSVIGNATSLASLDRLVRYYCGLHTFLNSFVSFRDFYSRDRYAMFQYGTLFLDGRSCDFCVKVQNIESHVALASLSRVFLAYCHCSRPDSPQGMTIAAAFTGGDSDNLIVGRNGVFYDRQGRDWDAQIVKIVANPISIRESFFLPYKRAGRMITEQIEKFAVAKEKAVADSSADTINKLPLAPVNAVAEKPPFDVGKFAGIFAAIGLAIGAIGTAIASVLTGFMSLPLWEMPIAFLGLILAISGPSMLIAWLKLRARNVAPLLDASGWAINGRAKMNLLFGEALTGMPKLPVGSERTLRDPYAEKKTPWGRYLFFFSLVLILAVVVWKSGIRLSEVQGLILNLMG